MIELTGWLLQRGSLKPGRISFGAAGVTAVQGELTLEGAERDRVIAPGLIDLHVHGFGGHDPLEDLAGMAAALARSGTTAFQPTLFPAAPAALGLDAERLHAARVALRPGQGARVLGTHCEGPFVNPQAAGALPPGDLALPGPGALADLLGSGTGDGRGIATLTVASELPGALDLIEECRRAGLRVSLGHSRASGREAIQGFDRGAAGVTHLFNAMTPMHHRDAGLVGEALLRGGVFAEIIGDLVHVGERALQLALAARGPEGLCLVSDALRGAGTGCDVFHSHGRAHVIHGGAAHYPAADGTSPGPLAGSALGQWAMIQGLVRGGIVGLEDALTMASLAPARALGLDRRLGALEVGFEADLLVIDRRRMRIEQVYVAGKPQLPAA
ncbi:MAG: amidohydrolase family protein [Planctomycetota bacterium]